VQFYRRDVYIDCNETEVAGLLAEVQNSFREVHIGSYPSTTETRYILLMMSLYDVMMMSLIVIIR